MINNIYFNSGVNANQNQRARNTMVNKSQDNPEVFGKKVVFKMSLRIKRRAEMTLAFKNSKSKVEENPLP